MTSTAKTYLLVLGVPVALFVAYIGWRVLAADPQAAKDRQAIEVCDTMAKRGSMSPADCQQLRTDYRAKYGSTP
ncbi:MAG: hypothetical protein HZT39_09680 [Pseudoxanthomonas sp.]|nr:MAG: hypothetical protein HZT39_09680 [Pseudoxanthomonas sp.]